VLCAFEYFSFFLCSSVLSSVCVSGAFAHTIDVVVSNSTDCSATNATAGVVSESLSFGHDDFGVCKGVTSGPFEGRALVFTCNETTYIATLSVFDNFDACNVTNAVPTGTAEAVNGTCSGQINGVLTPLSFQAAQCAPHSHEDSSSSSSGSDSSSSTGIGAASSLSAPAMLLAALAATAILSL
jgi:hypothetical protein